MKNAYPIVMTQGKEFIVVFIPDFDINTQGADLPNAIEMARDAIGLMGIDMQNDGEALPEASSLAKAQAEAPSNAIVSLVDVDFAEYRRKNDLRVVKKNCTIPSWLNFGAERAGVNFSAILQAAVTNLDKVKSRRDYNKYIVAFPSIFDFTAIKQYLIVETSVFFRAYPSKRMTATSFIYDYLRQENREDIISQFSLEPFELNVQGIERTFIDKLFAVGDYYLDNRLTEHSRHIYDLYKLFDAVEIKDSLKELFELVRKERSGHATCLSAQEGVNLKDLLQKIICENAYKNDYEAITSGLLFEKIPYETAIGALQKIIDSELICDS